MRKLALVLVLLAGFGSTARADVGFGLFLGRPTGFDAKIGLDNRSGLDLLLGWDTYAYSHADYAHLTYLLTPVVGRGRSVIVPVRVGIGLAVYDSYYYNGRRFGDGLNAAVRLPVELGLRFRSVPFEIYGELALRINFIRDDRYYDFLWVDGGIGFRFYL